MKILGGNNKINSLFPLKRISPSRYSNFIKCSLQEVFIQGGEGKLLPSSPNTYFGQLSHKLLSDISLGNFNCQSNIDDIWTSMVLNLEEKLEKSPIECNLVPLEKNIKRYEVKKRFLFKSASKLLSSFNNINNGSNFYSGSIEKWLQTKDGTVGGYIDKILIHNSGIYVIDYKTGILTKPQTNIVKEEYVLQMLLYGALIYENYGEFPILKLVGLNGEEFQLNYDKGECIKLLEQSKQHFTQVNNLIQSTKDIEVLQEELANPEPLNCRYCSMRPVCKPYWSKREGSNKKEWPNDIRGHIKNIQLLGNGTYLIKISTSTGFVSVRGIQISRLSLKVESYVNIYNLVPDNVQGSFSQGLFTIVYTEKCFT